MRYVFAAAMIVLAYPAFADRLNFESASRWRVACAAARQMPDPFPIQSKSVELLWDRRAGAAELYWPNGVKKFLRQLNVDASYSVSFWFGPETSLTLPSDLDGTVDCCYNSLLSLRSSGEYALTEHDISGGGMRALSQEGECKFTPLAD